MSDIDTQLLTLYNNRDYDGLLEAAQTEIDRLRNEVSALRGLLGGGRTELIDRYEAEIERLRGIVSRLESRTASPMLATLQLHDQATRLRSEIERLRAAEKLMIQQFQDQESKETMLRGLLRDGITGLDPRWMTTDVGREWLLRVREALGHD